MGKSNKYYTVWVGRSPGVYDRWSDCEEQITGFPGARYKSFPDREAAVAAFRGKPSDHLDIIRAIVRHQNEEQDCQRAERAALTVPGATRTPADWLVLPGVRSDAIAVDGACAGNPGAMEYRAVRLIDGAELFRIGNKTKYIGTNNIAEYLGMIHLAAMLTRAGDFTTPIYTDSRNTLAWLRRGRSNTKLEVSPDTQPTLELLRRADAWLAANGPIRNPILKWDTDRWGEIPADFGRKG